MFNVNADNQQSTENNVNNLSAIPEDETLHQGHSQFQVHKIVEKFYRNTHLLKLIEGCVQKFVAHYQDTKRSEDLLAPLQLRLDFVVGDLAKRAPQLLRLVIREPIQFAEAVKYAAFSLVRQQLRLLGHKPVDIGQLHAQWRLVGLQFHPNLLFDPGQQSFPLGLSFVQGILSAYTPPETLVLQTIWFCGSGCLRNALQTSSTDAPLCSNCSRPMSEYQKLRVTESYRLLAVLSISSVQTPRNSGCIHRAILARARDHTYDLDLKLGADYLITGYFTTTSTTYNFEVCHLRRA
ncbi:uncharacterized protein [Drosophila tropicalis]|uniref:uncharacterized protein isoform X2 n=1 Tax=Drosophila tropicalis TaxID=46794 RepID=UPI0035ABD489